MMPDPVHFLSPWLGSPNIHSPVDQSRIHRNDLSIQSFCQPQRKFSFTDAPSQQITSTTGFSTNFHILEPFKIQLIRQRNAYEGNHIQMPDIARIRILFHVPFSRGTHMLKFFPADRFLWVSVTGVGAGLDLDKADLSCQLNNQINLSVWCSNVLAADRTPWRCRNSDAASSPHLPSSCRYVFTNSSSRYDSAVWISKILP